MFLLTTCAVLPAVTDITVNLPDETHVVLKVWNSVVIVLNLFGIISKFFSRNRHFCCTYIASIFSL